MKVLAAETVLRANTTRWSDSGSMLKRSKIEPARNSYEQEGERDDGKQHAGDARFLI